MQIILYLCTLFSLRKYAFISTHRGIYPADGASVAFAGQATDVLAAVQQRVRETGTSIAAYCVADIRFYRCDPDDSSQDQHGKSAVADVHHGFADEGYATVGVLEHDPLSNLSRQSGIEHRVGDRHDAYHGADRRDGDHGREQRQLLDSAEDSGVYDDDADVGDHLHGGRSGRRLRSRSVDGHHHDTRLFSGGAVRVQPVFRDVRDY